MQPIIQEILNELYANDPALQHHDTLLRTTLAELIRSKPNPRFDPAFKERLRTEVLAKIAELQRAPTMSVRGTGINFFTNMKKFVLLGGGATLALLLLIVPIVNTLRTKTPVRVAQTQGVNITPTRNRAFGSLTLGASSNTQSGRQADNAAGEEKTTPSFAAPVAPLGLGGGRGVADSGKISAMPAIIAPESTVRYAYRGDQISVDQPQLAVLKRVQGANTGAQAAQLLQGGGFGLANLSALQNAKLQSFNIVEDRDGGYNVFVDAVNGSISMDINWQRWSQSDRVPTTPLRPSDVPDDAALIALADQFLQTYGISRAAYGSPEVDSSWKTMYARGGSDADIYIPQNLTVLYPLVIDGKTVYQDWGNKFGLSVNIDILKMKVTGFYNLTVQQYDSSMYATEQDTKKILEVAERGGNQPIYYIQEGGKAVELELGTPELAYLLTYQYTNNQSSELLVPAFVFPVTGDTAETGIYRQRIIVPIVKELLEQQNSPPNILMKGVEDVPQTAPAAPAETR